MNRRPVLKGTAATLTVSLAGCSGIVSKISGSDVKPQLQKLSYVPPLDEMQIRDNGRIFEKDPRGGEHYILFVNARSESVDVTSMSIQNTKGKGSKGTDIMPTKTYHAYRIEKPGRYTVQLESKSDPSISQSIPKSVFPVENSVSVLAFVEGGTKSETGRSATVVNEIPPIPRSP